MPVHILFISPYDQQCCLLLVNIGVHPTLCITNVIFLLRLGCVILVFHVKNYLFFNKVDLFHRLIHSSFVHLVC